MEKLNILGIMSGSSMDGVDLALCEIDYDGDRYVYKILEGKTYNYDDKWRLRLSKLRTQNAMAYAKTDVFYAHYLASLVADFKANTSHQIDAIASHGHTIFHNPEQKLTAQVGDGSTLAAIVGIPVISDFRRGDVAIGGEGAPLVGIGDEHLFREFDFCLNLGGFANISTNIDGSRIAFDVAACNILTNRLARDLELAYDEGGEIASKGTIDYDLLNDLNEVPYFSLEGPKSLNRDWISKELWPVVKHYRDLPLEDRMKTIVDHIAYQIGKAVEKLSNGNSDGKRLFITGGGAFNHTLIEHIKSHTEAEVVIPAEEVVDYKEALIFAFLGYLRLNNADNTAAAATGAKRNLVSGALSGKF